MLNIDNYAVENLWLLVHNVMLLKSHKSFLLLKLESNQNICSSYLYSVICIV